MRNKKTIYIGVVLVIVAIAVASWNYFRSVPQEITSSALSPGLEITEKEKTGDVSEEKAQILMRVRSGTALTQQERDAWAGLMLVKSHIYQFSDGERKEIFDALSR